MTTLRERVTDLETIALWIDEHHEEIAANEGALPPELEALLNEGEASFDEKAERVALVIKSIRLDAKLNKEAEEHYASRRRVKVNHGDRLESYLFAMMQAVGKTHVKGALADVAIAQSPPAVQSVLDEFGLRTVAEFWPALVTAVPASYVLDKKATLALHKEGKPLPDGVTVTVGSHLRVR